VARTLWSACAIALVLPHALPAQDAASAKCVFEGKARNTVTDLAVGQVIIRLIPFSGSVAYAGSSKSDGTFRFENIAPGDYRVEAQRTGYSAPWILSDPSGRAVSIMRLAAGQTLAGNTLWLAPDGAISGKVIGADGEPLSSAPVSLIERRWRWGRRAYAKIDQAETDDSGAFHFSDVPAGRYWVYAGCPLSLSQSIVEAPGKPEMRIAGRYYPNAAQLDRAGLVEVHAGGEAAGIEFKLPLMPVFHVSGTYTPIEGDASHPARHARLGDQPLDWGGAGLPPVKDGKFDIPGVLPGDYFLTVEDAGNRRRGIAPKLPFAISDRDISGLSIPPVTRVELREMMKVDGETPTGQPAIEIAWQGREADDYSFGHFLFAPEPDGTFRFSNITPDRYTISITNWPDGDHGGLYLQQVLVNGVAAPANEIDLTGGAPSEIELLLSTAAATVAGTVIRPEQPADAKKLPEPEPSGVVLIPEKLPSGAIYPIFTTLDAADRFEFPNLEPGTYRLLAVPPQDFGLWRNPDFLRRIAERGVEVEVSAKARVSVEVHALRAADVRQVEEGIP
jgi:hypothetical protein